MNLHAGHHTRPCFSAGRLIGYSIVLSGAGEALPRRVVPTVNENLISEAFEEQHTVMLA